MRGSRPPKTRARRSSPSSATPGARGAAPVERSITGRAGDCVARRITFRRARPLASVVTLLSELLGGTCRRPRTGSEVNARRATSIDAGRARKLAAPNSRTGTALTARK